MLGVGENMLVWMNRTDLVGGIGPVIINRKWVNLKYSYYICT